LNVIGFCDRLLEFLDQVTGQGFLKTMHRKMLLVDEDPASLLQAMAQYRAPVESKWIEPAAI
jgi:predicted Rossmann-fold nucleotide-binding protein